MTGPANTVPGPEDEQGLRGFNGTQGPAGPSGITFMNSTNTYTKVKSSSNLPFQDTPPFYTQAFATCNPGDLAIAGGFIGPPVIPLPAGGAAAAFDAILIQDIQSSPDTWGYF